MEKLSKKIIAYKAIKNKILNHELDEDYLYSENKLADITGLTRVPVREAVQLLENEGLVRVEPRKGILICPMNLSDVRENFDIRIALEPFILKSVFSSITDDDVEHMYGLIEKQRECKERHDADMFLEYDRQIHFYLLNKYHNNRLKKLLIQIYDQIVDGFFIIGRQNLEKKGRYELCIRQHTKYVDAIAERNLKKAVKVLEYQLKCGRDNYSI